MAKKQNRKKRSDSAAEQQRIVARAGVEINSPRVKLTDEEKVFFDAIIDERAKADWTAHRVDTAAILAKLMLDVIRSPNEKGVVSKHNAIISYRRSLGIHSRAQDGEMQDFEARREAARKLQEKAKSAAADDFIAQPTVN